MIYKQVHLEGFGYDLPDEVLSSQEIENRLSEHFVDLGIFPGKLEAMTGIKERRIWPIGTKPSVLAASSGKKALDDANIKESEIDLLIHCGVCRDALEPATANVVHYLLGLAPHCVAFDISNACVGFLNALLVSANYIELGFIKTALIVSGENAGPIYPDTINHLRNSPSKENMRVSIASLTLGSGSVGFVLRHKDVSKTTHQLLGGIMQVDSSAHHVCEGNGDIYHLKMQTDTETMLKKGLQLLDVNWELFKKELQWDSSTLDFFISHQISKSHTKKALELMKLPEHKTFLDYEYLGNTGSVSVPIGLAMRAKENIFQEGHQVALLGIASGLSSAMLGVRW